VEKYVRFVRAYGGQVGALTGCIIIIDQRRRIRKYLELGAAEGGTQQTFRTTDLQGRTQDEVVEHSGNN
jgi:hypothetical protein